MKKEIIFLEVKQLSEDGTFEGLLSPYGNIDGGKDVVEKGAYTKTLQERGNQVPMLWQHDHEQPIGTLTLDDRPDGLWCKGQLLLDLPTARYAYICLKAKAIKGLSIGFEAIKKEFKDGIRYLKEIKLWEGSIVTFPMNELAMVTAVKAKMAEQKGDFNQELATIQLSESSYQMRYALSNALSSLFWSGMTKEEMLSTADTIISQFHEAYMAYLPQYIDLMEEYYGPVEEWSKKPAEFKSGMITKIAGEKDLRALINEGIEEIKALMERKAGTTTSPPPAADPAPAEPEHKSHSEDLTDLFGKLSKEFGG